MASDDTQDTTDTQADDVDQDQASAETNGQRADDDSSDDQNSDDGQQEEKGNWLEKVVAAAGALIVLFTLGFLIFKIASGAGDPPKLVVRLGDPIDEGNQFVVPVEVENTGGSVAAGVEVEVCAAPMDCAYVEFDFLPHESKRRGKVGFNKPLSGTLTPRIVGYREP